jgi:hypothetical protein
MAPVQDPVACDLERLRKTVGQVFGSVFYGTLLKTMRESELKGPYGHGGYGEEVFSAQLHGLLAERAGTSMHNGLVDAVYEALAQQQELISKQQPRVV